MARSRSARPRSALYRRALLTATWLVGGVVAVAVGFGAVALVGDEVTERSAAPLSQRAVDAALAGRTTTSPPPANRPDRGSDAAAEGTTPIPSLSTTPPAAAPRSRTPRSPDDRDGPDDPAGTPTGTPAGPLPRPASFQLNGGKVVVACTGPLITLRYAVPKDGYRSDVDRSASKVEVEFVGQGHHSHLSAVCRNGVPVGQVEEDWDDDSGDHFTG